MTSLLRFSWEYTISREFRPDAVRCWCSRDAAIYAPPISYVCKCNMFICCAMALHAMDVLPRVGILCALRHRLTYPSSQFTHETAMHVISPCQIAVNGSLRSFGYLDPGKFVTANQDRWCRSCPHLLQCVPEESNPMFLISDFAGWSVRPRAKIHWGTSVLPRNQFPLICASSISK